jgi:cysteate synthase
MVGEKYFLKCLECGQQIRDSYTNFCSNHDSLLRTEYVERRINPKRLHGMWRFIDWLPVTKPLDNVTACPVTYKSETFAREIELSNLYISFSGYWPEKGAYIETCSFKELEAPPTFQRANNRGILVVASSGNTGRAFAQIASATNTPIVTVIPKRYLHRMWTTKEPRNVFLVSVEGNYSDAIRIAGEISALKGIINEGGVKNVARRDGLGVVLLNSLFSMKRLPDCYFQAVGTGTGVIAAWEASIRILKDGRFGSRPPKLFPSQNIPFAPMFNAWRARRRKILPEQDLLDAEKSINHMYANILSSINPAYSIKGGIYDALTETSGTILGVTNEEAKEAEKLFENTEGIDLDPAASVAVGSLIQAVRNGIIEKDDTILLNISGGGLKRLKEDYSICEITPCLNVDPKTPPDEIRRELKECLGPIRRKGHK